VPREPKDKNNALRQLRGLMNPPGKPPLPQPALAKIINVPLRTIQALECGARRSGVPSNEILNEIRLQTTAEWDKEARRWVSLWPDGKPEAFSFKIYEQYRAMSRPKDDAEHVAALWSEISDLFTRVPDSRWWDLNNRIWQSLDSCRKVFRLDEAEHIYGSIPEPPNKSKAQLRKMTEEERLEDNQRREAEFLGLYQEELAWKGHQKSDRVSEAAKKIIQKAKARNGSGEGRKSRVSQTSSAK
jgi:hypothetical protein